MPAPLVKGLLLSLSLLTALSVAALENPQVQAWFEDQRRRIGELLRSIGEELDPESRRAAEAFAFEGKTPATHEGLRREVSGSKEAIAVATGRSLYTVSAAGIGEGVVGLRRIAVKGPSDADEAEERRRKGREYLAKRNQKMYELKQSRKAAAKADGPATPPSPTSFDDLVDVEGKLKGPAVEELDTLPSPPAINPVPETVMEDMREIERQLVQPLVAEASSSGTSAFQWGARLANPFSDDFDLERSATPKPYLSPTVASEHEEEGDVARPIPGSFSPPSPPIEEAPAPESADEELSYEEQLAIALSLSEADELAAANAAIDRERNPQTEDDDLRAAIQASLREMNGSSAAYALAPGGAVTPPLTSQQSAKPSRDEDVTAEQFKRHDLFFLPTTSRMHPFSSQCVAHTGGEGNNGVHENAAAVQPDTVQQPPEEPEEEEDELYRLTPQLTRARLHAHQEAIATPPSHDTKIVGLEATNAFYTAPSTTVSPSPAPAPVPATQPSSPVTRVAGVSYHFDTESETSSSETFASLSQSGSLASANNEEVEVLDPMEMSSDATWSDDEMDGVLTPDSWTEVGSLDGIEDGSVAMADAPELERVEA